MRHRTLMASVATVVSLGLGACSVSGGTVPSSSGGSTSTADLFPSTHTYPVGTLATAVANFITSPDAVAGANNWNCKPTASHPYPVVLVPATGVNMGANYATISPILANAGFCVFSFNYGMDPLLSLGRIGGLTDIAGSAQTMANFVDQVLAATGASKVDVVGHSQGGMMPNYYIKNLGGASKVNVFVGLAPSNHGTTFDGVVTLASNLGAMGFAISILNWANLAGLEQQMAGSPFQTSLFGTGDTVPGPTYVVIETNQDHVVTPYTNAFLQGAENITVQNQCPNDPVGHVGVFGDYVVIQDLYNALTADDPNFQPVCTGYGLPL